GIDFALDRMGSISGHLTDALTGNGIYATLTAYDSQGVQVATTPYFYGTYSVDGLEPGIYYLKASAFLTYVDELYDNIPCNDGCDVTTGTPVIVTDGADTPNIDFVLEPVQIFDDVPLGYWARYWIQELYWAGITSGCATDPLRYCPQTPELRNQMAVFLLRSKERSSYTPPPAVGAFDDVPIDDPFAPWIEELAARGITAGCSADPPLYCPNAPVTRRQMAKFLLSTLEGPLYQPPAAVGVFDDVPVGDPFAPWIEDLAARGITAGCSANPPLFCPNNPVSRAEMAVFLVKTFNLQ
ncbi:MAG: S-layer homology domain-containing protein, partial [Acidobacteria bacterium]|nr:S-layer homology domain-containing protein [Acidobacteriota bacterium]